MLVLAVTKHWDRIDRDTVVGLMRLACLFSVCLQIHQPL